MTDLLNNLIRETFLQGTLAAEYTTGRQPMLTINRIANGRRTFVERINVAGKREASAVAKARGATPWNF